DGIQVRTDRHRGRVAPCIGHGRFSTPPRCAAGRCCWSRCRRRSWSWRPAGCQGVALTTHSGTAHTVAEVLSKIGVVLLHSRCGRCVPVGQRAIDDIKASLSLIQPQLEVGTATPREVLRPPLNVETAVGRTATYRGEYAEP